VVAEEMSDEWYKSEWRWRRSYWGNTWVAERLDYVSPHWYVVPVRRYFKTKEEAVQYAARKNLEIWQKKREDEKR